MIGRLVALLDALGDRHACQFVGLHAHSGICLSADHLHFLGGDLHTLDVGGGHDGRLLTLRRRQWVSVLILGVPRHVRVVHAVGVLVVLLEALDGVDVGHVGLFALECHLLDR
ncbi:hypothetical protein D3C75_1109350 [compost metagenome]